ncbi:hypothetical protein JB92DRAFT_3007041 [Gautieria morchelliformis]|nr:hypothetical protein JB92DRAFT_3007041 [Gautieria morchelliformis]
MSTVFRNLTRPPRRRLSPPFGVRTPAHALRSRFLHAETGPARSGGGVSVSTVFTILTVIGVGATAYGVYEFYTAFAVWPKELRDDLRPAIKAQQQGDLTLSERYLRRAWDACLALPKEKLGVDPWLKISGIACKLGEVLEAANSPQKAYEVYAQCCTLMRASAARDELSVPERHRAIAIAMHLGELAEQLGKNEEEEWLLWSVEEFIRIYHSKSGTSSLQHMDHTELEATELTLPAWTQKDDFEAALEALGSWYAKNGNTEYALNLYLRAISVILPPDSPEARAAVSPLRRCRAAQLMTNISGVLINDSPSPERLAQAKSWTSKGMEVAETARNELARSSRTKEPECERVWAVLLYNMGAVLEMQSDREAAKEHFERALVHAQNIKMREGVLEADDALARLSASKDI